MEIAGVDLSTLEFETIGSWPLWLRNIILVCVFLVLLMLGFMFDVSDKMDALENITVERKKLQENFTVLHHQAVNLDAYRTQVNTVKNTLSEVTKQLPSDNEEAQMLEEISQKAIASGLHFRSIKPGPAENKGFYSEQQFEMSLLGSYHGFGQFVSLLSSMPRIVTIHDFNIQKTGAGDKLDITVFVKVYWIGPEGSLR